MADLSPEHTIRRVGEGLHSEITAAYRYVDSVVHTADAQSPVGGHAWHGWALSEAFLAGMLARHVTPHSKDTMTPRPYQIHTTASTQSH